LVIGDACTDETEQVVTGIADPRVQWFNLPQRHRSQSGPNNAGLSRAKGRIVAYLGHDDLWDPRHLANLAALFARRPLLDFGVSGMVLHAPHGMTGTSVVGLFDDFTQPRDDRFPPSCLAHRHDVMNRIGPWQMPDDIARPVDDDFQLRGLEAGMVFGSTGKITVHKFTASHRYLSYVAPSCDEQDAMLAAFKSPDHAAQITRIVADARADGTYMSLKHEDYSTRKPGEIARTARIRRGVEQADAQPLTSHQTIRQLPANCAEDWIHQPDNGIRWTQRNAAPHFLLPYTCEGPVAFGLHACHHNPQALARITIGCNGDRHVLRATTIDQTVAPCRATYHTTIRLRADRATVIRFELDDLQFNRDEVQGRFGLGNITLWPVPQDAPKADHAGTPE
jgi:hypothetical protein